MESLQVLHTCLHVHMHAHAYKPLEGNAIAVLLVLVYILKSSSCQRVASRQPTDNPSYVSLPAVRPHLYARSWLLAIFAS